MLRDTFIYAESWNVAFRKGSSGDILKDNKKQFTVIKNNFRYWAADPFIVERGDKAYIFAELYDYISRKGIIGFCTVENGKTSKWKPLLKEDYHLSYPCIIEKNGKMFMMPESGEGKVLTVYESIQLPTKWSEKHIVRKDVKYADTTPFPKSEEQLALTHEVSDSENPKLLLVDFSGNREDFSVTCKNNLRSRPAGNVFCFEGKTVRPAQISRDTGRGYGKGLVFYECCMNKDGEYNESELKELYPNELSFDKPIFLDGMHTYNSSKDFEVIDIKTRRFNALDFVMRLISKFLKR